jgi:Kef-type K+ transport system membrane component KefB
VDPQVALSAADAIRRLSVEDLLLPVLLQLAVIVAVSRVAANVFRRLGQPSAVGEIIAGLMLGPSLLGWLAPDVTNFLFKPHLHGLEPALGFALLNKIFTVLAQIGLVFLLFLIGLEFDFNHLRYHGRTALAVSLSGVLLPFALGVLLAFGLHGASEPHPTAGPIPFWGFALFMGVAMSITAIPILGRMMIELNIHRTKLGALTITSAAVDDAVGWILLATVASAVKSGFEPLLMLRMIGLTVGFTLFMLWVAGPWLCWYVRWTLARNEGKLSMNALATVLALLFLCAIATSLIGIFAIFGAFILGATLSNEQEFRTAIAERMRDMVTAFFLPIFFTFTGLRTDITALGSTEAWLWCAAVFAAAVVGKFGGCGVAAWLGGLSPRESAVVGVMMNTRALMELIVINVGYELGVIPKSVFCMLVLMAIGTTIMTTPILLWLAPKTELEPYIRQSEFRHALPAA